MSSRDVQTLPSSSAEEWTWWTDSVELNVPRIPWTSWSLHQSVVFFGDETVPTVPRLWGRFLTPSGPFLPRPETGTSRRPGGSPSDYHVKKQYQGFQTVQTLEPSKW